MKVAFFSTKPYEQGFFNQVNDGHHKITYFETHLNESTAAMARSHEALCCFVSDKLSQNVLAKLHEYGIRLIALRSAGFNHVDVKQAKKLPIKICYVPEYSPHAIAEHTVALMLSLNHHIHRAYNRVKEQNFLLHGLMGFDMKDKIVGIIGLGRIGKAVAEILNGFGCHLLGNNPVESDIEYVKKVTLDELVQQSDIITLHCTLNPNTRHLIHSSTIKKMKPGVMLINTSRGAVIDSQAVIDGLKSKHIGYLGIDVYEEEGHLFFEDLSDKIISDDVFARLMTFPNVLVTGHQGFFTHEAMLNIASITLKNITSFE